MTKLHYQYDLKKDLLSVYCVAGETNHLLGCISIKNTSLETKADFLADMVEAKERILPSEAPWHANKIFDEQGRIKNLTIRKYGNTPQWYLKKREAVKIEKVKPAEASAQVEYYTQQLMFAHDIPNDGISATIVRHAVTQLLRDVTFNRVN